MAGSPVMSPTRSLFPLSCHSRRGARLADLHLRAEMSASSLLSQSPARASAPSPACNQSQSLRVKTGGETETESEAGQSMCSANGSEEGFLGTIAGANSGVCIKTRKDGVYDDDGYRTRAACVCVRNELETEVESFVV